MTTHDELFRDAAFPEAGSAATKEVARYSHALLVGFEAVKKTGLLTNNHIVEIQSELEQNTAGFRKLAGTALKASDGRVVLYTAARSAHDRNSDGGARTIRQRA